MRRGLFLAPVPILLSSVALCGQDPPRGGPTAAADSSSNQDSGSNTDDSDWVRAWMKIAAKARASQPHFVAPIVTTHVMLVQPAVSL